MAVKMPHMGSDMAAWMMAASKPGGVLWTIALLGLPFMIYLLGAALSDVRRALLPRAVTHAGGRGGADDTATSSDASAHSCHDERPVGTPSFRASALADFAMNFGMFWMSTGLLVPVLPFFAALAF